MPYYKWMFFAQLNMRGKRCKYKVYLFCTLGHFQQTPDNIHSKEYIGPSLEKVGVLAEIRQPLFWALFTRPGGIFNSSYEIGGIWRLHVTLVTRSSDQFPPYGDPHVAEFLSCLSKAMIMETLWGCSKRASEIWQPQCDFCLLGSLPACFSKASGRERARSEGCFSSRFSTWKAAKSSQITFSSRYSH